MTLFHWTTRKMFTMIRILMERSRSICRWLGGLPWFSRFNVFCCLVFDYIRNFYLHWRNGGGNDRSVTEGEKKEYVVDPTDELYCDYDSTWETEQSQDSPAPKRNPRSTSVKHQNKFSRFQNAAKDMQNYRHGYPYGSPNLDFYLGQTRCEPDGVYIYDIHREWFRDYHKLEFVHTYIQWLFPLREPGMNYQASPLTEQEVQAFCQSTKAKQNLLESYKLMLDFYGIELEDETTGAVRRAENWKNRFDNLNRHTHNNLRLTRILKCLGTLGYPHYQAPLVHFFLEQTLVYRELPNVKESVLNYFVFAVLNKVERRNLIEFAYRNYTPKEEFVWCPKKMQESWSLKQDAARNNEHNELTGKNNEELV